MVEKLKFQTPVYVTSPLLPSLDKLNKKLEIMWQSKWVTNHGNMHNRFEQKLHDVLKAGNVSVFNNGTIALLTALAVFDLPRCSEVITTPFTFPATPHCITWNGLRPVFCDIDPDRMTIDADKIESLVNRNTSAILGVHVYGIPSDVKKIQAIANKYNLKVIYDAAHAFTTEINGIGIGDFGDISMFSFHATKLFNTIEGGCLTYSNPDYREKIYYLRNFGIKDEEQVVDIGINGKMNEVQAAIGLLNLELFEKEKQKRQLLKEIYKENLQSLRGIKVIQTPENVTDSMEYFVIRIDKDNFGLSRNEVYDRLKEYNVFTRKYFCPLCSEYEPYKALPSSDEGNLPVANKIKNEVLCLPLYGDLGKENVGKICKMIKYLRRRQIVTFRSQCKGDNKIHFVSISESARK